MADKSDAAELARAQAEARRKRILEKASKRLGKVSGEVGLDEDNKKESATNAARIRAARQRRYGKKGAAKTSSTSKETEVEKVTANTAEEKNKAETKDETTATGAQDAPKNESSKEESLPAKVSSKDEYATPLEEKLSVLKSRDPKKGLDESQEPKKKYLGVAKMRRKLILKKKKMSEIEASNKDDAPSTKATDVKLLSKATASPAVTIPVYMHILTILLLFLAGVDVGVQQYHEDVRIHDQLAFKEFGIPILGYNKPLTVDVRSLESEPLLEKSVDFEDEFQTDEDDTNTLGNIDPVFRVDLDNLTKGSGIFNQLARGAIAVHRLVLQFLYYTPKSIFQSLLGMPKALMQTPPALCLVALVMRQIVGKKLLKAGIPVSEVQEKDSVIDVVALVKQGITNFISSAFPTAVGLYDTLSHLRSDMYIIMCGVFFGIAWTHMLPSQSYQQDGLATDEL
jgi:hypothetical protein